MNNISKTISAKRLEKLHNNPSHPICQLKEKIQSYFDGFEKFDKLSEVVTIENNFDDLLIPSDHPSRSMNDTYYVDENHVLRTQTSSHQNELMKQGHTTFVVTGDVCRKDTIDKTHYPVFHLMEGLKIVPKGIDPLHDLKVTLEELINHLFPGKEYRFSDDYFPFTEPSIEVEVKQGEQWMEVLGAGVIQPQILKNCGIQGTGWAFGLGIDRLLLSYCNISDIRYLWSKDPRFINQFQNGLTSFKEYSKYPPVLKDVSFWVNDYLETDENTWNQHNNLCEIIRDVGDDLIENVALIDKYAKAQATSLAYRITYRSNDSTLTNEEINLIQDKIRKQISLTFDVELR
jgi:phenylalanyl-tRNA synthetase alpha chain